MKGRRVLRVLNFVEMVDWETARKIIDEHQMVTTF